MMIELFTASTPNGWKASVMLEEIGLEYGVRPIDLRALEQKQDWYLKINPNGRIPAIIDHGDGDFIVFESGAILVYLADKTGKLLPRDPKPRSVVMQWLMFQMGGIGPMMGQANVFYHYAPEKIDYAIGRYQREGRRLFEVLDDRLADNEFLAGDYSIADIANFCWVHTHNWSGIETEGCAHLQRWIATMRARPAVQAGLEVPTQAEKDAANRPDDIIEAARDMLA